MFFRNVPVLWLVKKIVGSESECTLESTGVLALGSIIRRNGFFPAHSLVVNLGLSFTTVWTPTSIAASSLLHWCACCFEIEFEIQKISVFLFLSDKGAMSESFVWAHFNMT